MKANGNKKQCSKCKKVREASEFGANRTAVDGLQSWCNGCRKEYRDANAEKILASNKRYVAENRDRVNEYQRNYREAHPEKAATAAVRSQKHYRANRDREKERSARWHAENPQKVKESQRLYYERNQEARRENSRRWRRENPEQVAKQNEERRAREAGASIDSELDYARIYRRDRGICYLCGQKVKKSERHLDHVVPLRRGGKHSEDNLRVTHARCNLIKGSRLVEDIDPSRFD